MFSYGKVYNSFQDLLNASTLPKGGDTATIVDDDAVPPKEQYSRDEQDKIMSQYTDLVKKYRSQGKWNKRCVRNGRGYTVEVRVLPKPIRELSVQADDPETAARLAMNEMDPNLLASLDRNNTLLEVNDFMGYPRLYYMAQFD